MPQRHRRTRIEQVIVAVVVVLFQFPDRHIGAAVLGVVWVTTIEIADRLTGAGLRRAHDRGYTIPPIPPTPPS